MKRPAWPTLSGAEAAADWATRAPDTRQATRVAFQLACPDTLSRPVQIGTDSAWLRPLAQKIDRFF